MHADHHHIVVPDKKVLLEDVSKVKGKRLPRPFSAGAVKYIAGLDSENKSCGDINHFDVMSSDSGVGEGDHDDDDDIIYGAGAIGNKGECLGPSLRLNDRDALRITMENDAQPCQSSCSRNLQGYLSL